MVSQEPSPAALPCVDFKQTGPKLIYTIFLIGYGRPPSLPQVAFIHLADTTRQSPVGGQPQLSKIGMSNSRVIQSYVHVTGLSVQILSRREPCGNKFMNTLLSDVGKSRR